MDATDKLAIIFVSLLRSGLQHGDLDRGEGEDLIAQLAANWGIDLSDLATGDNA